MPHFHSLPIRPSVLNRGLRTVGILGVGLAFLAAGSGFAPTPADAQGFFWGDAPAKPRKKAKRLMNADEAGAETGKSSGKSKKGDTAERKTLGPLVVSVSLSRQRLMVYDANGLIAESPISSGRVGYSTPTGVFSVLEKRRRHYSNLYSGAPMPNMQRITWSGVAMHAGVLPGYPASHGCIRLPHGFSSKLFGMTSNGTRVIVTRDPVAPVSFSDPRLFAAFPPETADAETRTGALTKVADASGVVAAGNAVSSVIGVATAAAAGVENLSVAETARLSFRERRRLDAERLSAEIRTAGYEKATRANILAQANKELIEARAPLIAARADAERLADVLTKLEKTKASAERELAELTTPVVEQAAPEITSKSKSKSKKADRKRKRKVVDAAKRDQRIAEINETLFGLPDEIAAARSAWEAADKTFNEAEAVAKAADEKRRAALVAFNKVNVVLSEALAKEEANKRLAARRHLPVSVFISRSKQRLYVRQGYDEIFDVPVAFDKPEEPVGTHVFTALAFNDDKTGMKWSAVSVPYNPSKKKTVKSGKSNKGDAVVVASVDLKSQTPQAALERITIPEDVREQIADVMKPGSSLVISDLGIGNETGEFTDFIIPIR